MRQPSEDVYALLGRLGEPVGAFRRLLRGGADEERALDQIARSGEWWALPHLRDRLRLWQAGASPPAKAAVGRLLAAVPSGEWRALTMVAGFLSLPDRQVAHAAAETARRLLGGIPPGEWHALDAVAGLTSAPEPSVADTAVRASGPLLDAVPVAAWRIVPAAAELALAPDAALAQTAAHTICRVVEVMTPTAIGRLDTAMREHSYLRWETMAPADLERFGAFPGAWISLLGLASFHRSGYVRQAAVERLDAVTEGLEMPFLLLRLDDWVTQVREAAHAAVRRRVGPAYAVEFATNLPLVLRLQGRERGNHGQLVEDVLALLRRAESSGAIQCAFRSEDTSTRRAAFRLALEAEDADPRAVLLAALQHRDEVLRRWAAERVSGVLGPDELRGVLAGLARDRAMAIRREALRAYREVLPAEALAAMRAAVLDGHPSIRAEARRYLAARGEGDFAGVYRRALAGGDQASLRAAIAGLGETGTAEDAGQVLQFAAHVVPAIRRAAIRALSRLQGTAHVGVFLGALADPVRSVSREAVAALTAHSRRVDAASVYALFAGSPESHVRRNALVVLASLERWRSLSYLLQAACSSEGPIREDAERHLAGWVDAFGRAYSDMTARRPLREQWERAWLALDACGGALAPRLAADLRASLESVASSVQ